MLSKDDFRYAAHRHLLEMDASNSQLRRLVSDGETSGDHWQNAVTWHQNAHDAWVIFLGNNTQPVVLA